MVHPDIEKSAPDGSPLPRQNSVRGELGEVIEDAVAATAKNLRRISVIEGAGRKDELEIPEEVLREAIANAVIHREYGPRHVGQSVTVDIYPDRVEITNPGGLWGGKTLDNIADGTSLCRNAALMRLMSAVELPGGTGQARRRRRRRCAFHDQGDAVEDAHCTGFQGRYRQLQSKARQERDRDSSEPRMDQPCNQTGAIAARAIPASHHEEDGRVDGSGTPQKLDDRL